MFISLYAYNMYILKYFKQCSKYNPHITHIKLIASYDRQNMLVPIIRSTTRAKPGRVASIIYTNNINRLFNSEHRMLSCLYKTPWLMKPGDLIPRSQGLCNPYPESNLFNFSIVVYLFKIHPNILLPSFPFLLYVYLS